MKKRAIINIVFSLLLQFVTIISGFIVPRMIIETFGSETNGLLNSITSFIAYITLLQSGVGGVIRAALYKPLALKNHHDLCVILKTTESFFKKIAYFTILYIVVLSLLFPYIITRNFSFLYTFSLVIIVGISTAAQYFFGITYQMLLEADQKSYVYSLVQIITIILNTISSIVLINLNYSIQFVKFISSIFFVLRPLAINIYAKRKYHINTNVEIDNDMISQRWDGVAQAIAYFVHSKTDVFVLTIFSSLSNVSVYSVYALVTSGLTALIECVDKAVRAAFGNIIALKENEKLCSSFNAYNCLIHLLSTVIFSTACITIFNFVHVYTKNVNDANYQQTLFGVLILTAEYMYCLRMPYNAIITTAGKFKETKKSAYLEALINIIVSCILVKLFGLVGVAIGTLFAMIYRSISFGLFLSSNILNLNKFQQIKRYLTSLITYILSIFILNNVNVAVEGYFEWVVYAFCIFIIDTLIVFILNLLMRKEETIKAMGMLLGRKCLK